MLINALYPQNVIQLIALQKHLKPSKVACGINQHNEVHFPLVFPNTRYTLLVSVDLLNFVKVSADVIFFVCTKCILTSIFSYFLILSSEKKNQNVHKHRTSTHLIVLKRCFFSLSIVIIICLLHCAESSVRLAVMEFISAVI